MRKSFLLTLVFIFSATLANAAETLVWQLGKDDNSPFDFTIRYNPWEYGDAPDVSKSPAMDHTTHTFNYEIEENKLIARPEIVNCICSEWAGRCMHDNELVSGLRLTWEEQDAGTRRLTIDIEKWRNLLGGLEGIELTLPGGFKKVFNLPTDKKGGNGLAFESTFHVETGKNSLLLRIVTGAKHYKFDIDCISLHKTDAAPEPLPVILQYSFDATDAIYSMGKKGTLNLKTFNLKSGNAEVAYSVEDAFGKTVTTGNAKIADSKGSINLPLNTRGYFKVTCKLNDTKVSAPYVNIEPVTKEYVPETHFGCHAMNGDGYRIRDHRKLFGKRMRRAFLAGAKSVRYHSIHWWCREPEKGNYKWDFFGDYLDLAEEYKMDFLLTIGGTPKWASTSKSTKMTGCGNYFYQFFPPKDMKDYGEFVTTLASRYKGRIKYYEIGNEVGYSSAFWTNGSATDYGDLLKTAYLNIKKVDPDCSILPGCPLPPPSFLEEAVQHVSGKTYFDDMSFHYTRNNERGSVMVDNWKTMLQKMGKGDVTMFNTEEMCWGSYYDKNNTLAVSETMIKSHVRDMAQGVSRIYAFNMFSTSNMYGSATFDGENRIQPHYAAYRTLTHRLERTDFVADLSTPDAEIFLFDRQGTPVIVMWSDTAQKITLPLGASRATQINVMDVESELQANGGQLSMQIPKLPIFIEGGNIELLKSYAAAVTAFPTKLIVHPGKPLSRLLGSEYQFDGLQLQMPENWNGSVENNKLSISVPATSPEGIYDLVANIKLNGLDASIPFLVEVSSSTSGQNLIRNSDFSQGTAYWFYPKEQEKFSVISGAGIDGANAIRTRGTVHFGCAGRIKVRPGEKYALIAEAKGQGQIGCVYSLSDKDGKKLFPKRQGINCMTGTLTKDWKIFKEQIGINVPDAAFLKLSVLPNYGDNEGKEAFFNRFEIVRLTEKYPLSKALWKGSFAKTSGEPESWGEIPAMQLDRASQIVESKGKWSGPEDLSAACRIAMDDKFLYLNFDITDDKFVAVKASDSVKNERAWESDSIQIAFDPEMTGKEQTEILIARDSSGKNVVYKLRSFWTPELPIDITREGIMSNVKIDVQPTATGMNYKLAIPLNELYPLRASATEFGFSWLVNDNDGSGRKYIQWSSGIGPNKNANLFGLAKCAEK